MTKNKETTAREPAKAVGVAGIQETINLHVTMGDEQLARWRLAAERARADAFRIAAEFANSMSFWRRRGEYKMAGHAVLHHLHLALTG